MKALLACEPTLNFEPERGKSEEKNRIVPLNTIRAFETSSHRENQTLNHNHLAMDINFAPETRRKNDLNFE